LINDLVSLRMVLVGCSRAEQLLWQKAVVMASVPIDLTTHEKPSAIRTLLLGGVLDICVLNVGMPDGDIANVVKSARTASRAPLVFVSAPEGSVRVDGVDGMLTAPGTVAEARQLTESCVNARIPLRVLIVDDSSTMRSIVRKILSANRLSMDIHEATEGLASLQQLKAGNFDLVFLDYNMPGLNGLETLSRIKHECPNVAVVIITSAVDNSMAERARALGALAFLKKPFYPADIDAVLELKYSLRRSKEPKTEALPR
jgi:CheY-like chemotaxis protein